MADVNQIKLPNGNTYNLIDTEGRKEENLVWGGTNRVGSVSPIGMSLSNEHSANRLAYINGDSLYFEYSSNSGSTWTPYDYTSAVKSQFCTLSYAVPIGRSSSSTNYSTSSRTRITLTAQNGTTAYVYTNPRKMLINISSSSGGMQVLVEYRTGTNYKSGGAWSTFGTYNLSGWSGWNDIPLILGNLGGGTTQTGNIWQLRLTFIMTSFNSSYPTIAHVNSLRIYGENGWLTTSNMGATGHLYSYDNNQNATFPAQVSATKFNGTATNADKVNNLTVQTAVPANAKFTDTTYTLGTSGNNVTLTPAGGTAQSITAPYATNSGTATKADTIATEVGSSAGARPVFYAWLGDNSKVVYNNAFTYNPSGGAVTATKFVGALQGNADTATKLGTSTVGGTTTPIYLNAGVPTALSYTIAKSVPSNAVFTDTNNAVTQTATSTNANYEVLFSATADNTTRTEGARKNSNLLFNPSTGALQANKLQGIDSSGKVRVEFYNDAENRGRFYLYNSSQSSQIEMVGDGAVNIKNASGTADIVLNGNTGNIKCTTINGHNIPTTLSESVTYSFNATTTLSYIGKSITCSTGTKIVRAYFRYVNSAPVETAVVRSSTSLGSYYCDVIAYGKDASSPCLTFIIKTGETFYFWAKYSGNAQNNLDVHSVYIQDN